MSLKDTIMINLLARVSTKPLLALVFMVVHVISDTDEMMSISSYLLSIKHGILSDHNPPSTPISHKSPPHPFPTSDIQGKLPCSLSF